MTTSSKKNRKQKTSPELKIARAILIVLGAMAMLSYFSGCRATEKVITRTEYLEKVKIDTVSNTQYDSIYIRERGDTVYVSKYKYIDRYRVKIERDTVHLTDTLVYSTVPPMPETIKVPVKGFYWKFGVCAFWLSLLALIAYAIYRLSKLPGIKNKIQLLIEILKLK